jgi:Uma2 family endonuclease
MPQGYHSIIQRQLLLTISPVLSHQGIGEAFPELRCTFGGRSIVPDVTVFEEARIPVDAGGKIENVFSIAPDWTIEILSPEQSVTKVLKNINHCLDYGTQMGWLIDPESRAVTVSRTGQNILIIDEPDATIPVPEFARSIHLTIEEIFGWLMRSGCGNA